MAVKFYQNGAWNHLNGQKIYSGSQWQVLRSNDMVYLNGTWHDIGDMRYWMTTSKSGTFSMRITGDSPAVLIDWGDGTIQSYNIQSHQHTEITHKYASGFKSVKYICIKESEMNQITELDCSNNELTALDVSKNTGLKSLYCRNNQLTTLDVSKNTALRIFWPDINQLTLLDISKNSKLNTLFCGANQLSGFAINSILQNLVAHGITYGTLQCNYQSPLAPPTGQGLTDKQTLINRNWTAVITD